MKRLLLGFLLACVAIDASAAGPAAVRKTVEATTVITGSIVVAAGGRMASYRLDQPDKLAPALVQMIAKAIPQWEFSPYLVNGQPVAVNAKMSIRLVARRLDADRFDVSIRGVSFGQRDPAMSISRLKMVPPAYPRDAVSSRVEGTVYLLVKVASDGRVEDVGAEQVNLRVVASDHVMDFWRKRLGDDAVRAAKQWTFHPPTAGSNVHASYWFAHIPVNFHLRRWNAPVVKEAYGHWYSYVPGPRQLFSWADQGRRLASSVDAVPDGGIYQLGKGGLQLKPPPSGT